ncbi:MAG: HAMP domain-containing histidine kinase [Candidatus Gastranaerophilales bacterium]|nr:HAMP domain-containing histidine kinase [Candidatus Gastranaerophilales bacterium]
MKIRRLKIYQQLIIVLIVAVLLPLCITTLIVTNVNQHAVRAELRYSAKMTSDSVYQRFRKTIDEKRLLLLFVAKSINYIKSEGKIESFLRDVSQEAGNITSLELIDSDNNISKDNANNYFKDKEVEIFYDSSENSILMYAKLNDGRFLRKKIDIDSLNEELFKYLVNDKRQVYILDSTNKIIMAYNRDYKLFKGLLPDMPTNYSTEEPLIFGKVKNLPNVYLKMKEPDWSIVVVTPKSLISYGIIDARFKIITAIVVAAAAIIAVGILYSVSLNINIRQLFKAISAMAAGNYRRKARLIKDFFTPYEFAYLVEEFNLMAEKIDRSYKELQKANDELSRLDRMKSNLIDTVSHEFRTPLTGIRGHVSRLLRKDTNIDEETRIKSLKVIKQQAERINRLVDDLLVVPEIESEFLRVFPVDINIADIIEDCILSLQQKQSRQINFDINPDFPTVYADSDRFVQVVMNLLDNAIKYSPENSIISIKTEQEGDFACIRIRNEADYIPEDKLESLFDKFARLDGDLTHTKKGTGLGLFIVRGLIQAMGGEVSLYSDDGFEVRFTVPLAK